MAEGIQWSPAAQLLGLPATGTGGCSSCRNYLISGTTIGGRSKEVITLIEEGGLPKQTAKTLVKELGNEANPLKILAKLKTNIAPDFFKEPVAESAAQTSGPREVILSEYLVSE